MLQPTTPKAARRELRELVREVVKLLAGPFLESNPTYRDQVCMSAYEYVCACMCVHVYIYACVVMDCIWWRAYAYQPVLAKSSR